MALLETIPDRYYSPIVLEDETGAVFNKIVKDYFEQCCNRCCAVEIQEIIDVNDPTVRQWLLKTRPVLIIYNIEKFGADTHWQNRFFDLMNFVFDNHIHIIITSGVPINKLSVEGRIYARLNWGVREALEIENLGEEEHDEVF